MSSPPSRTKTTSAVFIASTPLQYINAREAAESFDVVPQALVIPLLHHNRSVFERMDPDGFWPEMIFVSRSYPDISKKLGWSGKWLRLVSDWFFYRRLTDLAKQLAPVHTLFVGFYDAYYQRHFANQLAPDRLVAVDDGAATVNIHRRRRTGPTPLRRPATIRLRHSLLGVEYDEFPEITLFTAYDLDKNYDRVVRNQYRHFRNRCDRSIQRDDDVWLLGQPAIVDSYMELSSYVRCVRDVVDAYSDASNVRYIPHPRERRDTVKTILNQTAVKLKQTDGPIEWELTTASVWPQRLVGFCTSAIQTCRKIFGDRLPTDVILPDPAVWRVKSEDIAEIFSMYRKTTSPPHRFVELEGLNKQKG